MNQPQNLGRSSERDRSRRRGEPSEQHEARESNQTLWLLAASPLLWVLHFAASYSTVAIWCGKVAEPDGSLGGARTAVAVYTAIALAGIAFVGWIGFQRQRFGAATIPHDFDSPEDRHRFLGFATVLLSVLSAVATIFVSLAAVFMERCH